MVAAQRKAQETSPVALSKKLTLIFSPELARAFKELDVCYPAEAAVFINQLAFWLLRSEYGYYTKDGTKWIYNSYQDWTLDQFTSLSPWQLGKMVRCLESMGIIEKSLYSRLRKFLVTKPADWHPHDTTSWISLNVERLVELTGCLPHGWRESLKPLSSAEVANTTTRDCKNNKASLRSQFPSIYKENSISTQDGEIGGEKETKAVFEQEDDFDPWNDELPTDIHYVDELKPESSLRTKIPHEDINSGRGGETLQNFTSLGEALKNQQVKQESDSDPWGGDLPLNPDCVDDLKKEPSLFAKVNHENPYKASPGSSREKKPQPKFEDTEDVKEIWEMAPGRPYSVFLNWWANRKYKPQGGRWEADAHGNAYAEFYNNRSKTTVAIFPAFLEYMQQVGENCNQQLANGIKAILPSCFVVPKEATHANVQQLMLNIAEVVEMGAQVALPSNSTTGASTQSMSFEQALDAGKIRPLPELEAPALNPTPTHVEVSEQQKLKETLERKQIIWKNIPAWRSKVEVWAKNTPGIMMTPSGPVLDTAFDEQLVPKFEEALPHSGEQLVEEALAQTPVVEEYADHTRPTISMIQSQPKSESSLNKCTPTQKQSVPPPPTDEDGCTENAQAYEIRVDLEAREYFATLHQNLEKRHQRQVSLSENSSSSVDGIANLKATLAGMQARSEAPRKEKEQGARLTQMDEIIHPRNDFLLQLEDMNKYLTTGLYAYTEKAITWGQKNGCKLIIDAGGKVVKIEAPESPPEDDEGNQT